MNRSVAALLLLLLLSCARPTTVPLPPASGATARPAPGPGRVPDVEAAGANAQDELLQRALAFTLPPPDEVEGEALQDLWATHYHLWESTEVQADDGFVVLDSDDRPFPADAPLHLSGRDWCYTALEGSGRVQRLDGTTVMINYSSQGEVHVGCDQWLGSRWRSQGRVRFGAANGPYGDGVEDYVLVPFRTIAVDRDQQTIPYGRAVFIAAAVGEVFDHEGQRFAHDGWFFAADTGGAIRDQHLDTFTGASAENTLDHVTGSPNGPRFDAQVLPGDNETADLLRDMHHDPDLWHPR